MKKLLGIVVLGLLLVSCTTTDELISSQKIKKRMSKDALKSAYYGGKIEDDPFINGCFFQYFPETQREILAGKSQVMYFVFEYVTSPKRDCDYHNGNMGNGHLLLWTKNYNEAKEAASPKKTITKKTEPKKKKPKQNPDDNKVVAFASGSGFFVSRTGHIVTNQHVIDQCKAVKVNYKGNEIEAKVLAEDKTNDLAILQANITPDKVYSVSNEDVSLLQDIIVAGFPLGKRVSAAIKTHKGNVSALAGYGDNYSNFQTDATINQGNSGGPVMDEKGNVVGVAVALMSVDAGQNIFFAVKSSTLKTFASSNGLSFLPPNNRPMSNKDLGQLITEGTVFLECWMTIAKIKQIVAQEENRRAFYSEYQ